MANPELDDAWARYTLELGIRLHQLRVARGLSQERLAGAADITTFTYRKLEKGQSNPGTSANPRLRTLAALASALEVELRDLLPEHAPDMAVGR